MILLWVNATNIYQTSLFEPVDELLPLILGRYRNTLLQLNRKWIKLVKSQIISLENELQAPFQICGNEEWSYSDHQLVLQLLKFVLYNYSYFLALRTIETFSSFPWQYLFLVTTFKGSIVTSSKWFLSPVKCFNNILRWISPSKICFWWLISTNLEIFNPGRGNRSGSKSLPCIHFLCEFNSIMFYG